MSKLIQISIPSPCHENWQQMTPVEKGRFCASCQKKVFDFRQSPDREIVTALKQDKHLCGRFLNTQLDRDLIVSKEKTLIGVAASAAAISLLTVGANDVIAQEPVPTEQHQIPIDASIYNSTPEPKMISGIVSDETGPLPGAVVVIKGTETTTQTDIDGKFSIFAKKGDILEISYVGFTTQQITVGDTIDYNAILMEGGVLGIVEIIYYKKRTFFGRIFHGIGNLFR